MNNLDKNSLLISGLFVTMFTLGLLGYIPGLPYWLYNISTFITIPIFGICLILINRRFVTLNELYFLFFFIFSLIFSYIASSYNFNAAGFFRSLVPILYYYLIRLLKINKSPLYFNILKFLLIFSFIFAFYQAIFQPVYILSDDGWVVYLDDISPLLKRPVSFLGNANVLGVFSVFCFIILFFDPEVLLSKKEKWFYVIIILLNIILFSKSRTSLISFSLVIFFFLIIKKMYVQLFILATLILFLSVFIYKNFYTFQILDDLFRLGALSDNDDNSYTIRARIADFSLKIIAQRPILGVGPGNEFKLMTDLNAPHRGSESASFLLLIERGILGYLIYLYVLIKLFFLNKKSISLFFLGIAIFAVDFTETVCVNSQLSIFLAIYLGVSKNEAINPVKLK